MPAQTLLCTDKFCFNIATTTARHQVSCHQPLLNPDSNTTFHRLILHHNRGHSSSSRAILPLTPPHQLCSSTGRFRVNSYPLHNFPGRGAPILCSLLVDARLSCSDALLSVMLQLCIFLSGVPLQAAGTSEEWVVLTSRHISSKLAAQKLEVVCEGLK